MQLACRGMAPRRLEVAMQPSDAAPVHQQTWPDRADLPGSQRCGHAAKRSAGVCWKVPRRSPRPPAGRQRRSTNIVRSRNPQPRQWSAQTRARVAPPHPAFLVQRGAAGGARAVHPRPGRRRGELGPGVTRCCTRPAEGGRGRGVGGLGGSEGLTDRSLTTLRLVDLTGFLDSR